MTGAFGAGKNASDVAAYFSDIRTQLAGLPMERIGEYRPEKKVLGITRQPRITPVGEAWHLGTLLIAPERVLATGDVARSLEPVRRGYTALSARARDELRFAAYRGGVPEGKAVHYNWTPIDFDDLSATGASGPLAIQDGELRIRWSPAGGYAPAAGYLAERIELLRASNGAS